jgi:dTDP-4-amino-4,6-dideoxygalactose transaminase
MTNCPNSTHAVIGSFRIYGKKVNVVFISDVGNPPWLTGPTTVLRNIAREMYRRGLWLPSSSFLSDEDIHYVCRVIKEYFNNAR